MTHDAAGILSARVGELMRADDRIAALARSSVTDPAARAAAILEAIADRDRIATGVLEAIAMENRALHSRMVAAAIPGAGATTLATYLIPRDRSIVALAHVIETGSREYNRIARRLEPAEPWARPGPERA